MEMKNYCHFSYQSEEYVIQMCVVEGNSAQDLYVFHVITSKLTGQAARLISERQDLNTYME